MVPPYLHIKVVPPYLHINVVPPYLHIKVVLSVYGCAPYKGVFHLIVVPPCTHVHLIPLHSQDEQAVYVKGLTVRVASKEEEALSMLFEVGTFDLYGQGLHVLKYKIIHCTKQHWCKPVFI